MKLNDYYSIEAGTDSVKLRYLKETLKEDGKTTKSEDVTYHSTVKQALKYWVQMELTECSEVSEIIERIERLEKHIDSLNLPIRLK